MTTTTLLAIPINGTPGAASQQNWTQYTYSYTATSTQTTLSFQFENDSFYWDLDGVEFDDQSSTNLLTNGGFETGDLTGWEINGVSNGGSSYSGGGSNWGVDNTIGSAEGSYNFFDQASGRTDTLSQTVSTVVGQTYTISFYLENEGGASGSPGDQELFVAQVDDSPPPCFASGTRILTSRGEVAVEALRLGDEVITASGARRPVRWIGHRRVACDRHPCPERAWPVRIEAGAFGPERPRRDLWLSPDHALFADGALVPAKCLVNGATIAQVPRPSVTYWHVELDAHDILLAEGLPAESYLECGNRAAFENSAGAVALHPDFTPTPSEAACAPLVMSGPALERLRARLLEQARTLGHRAAAQAHLHLRIGAEVYTPDTTEGGLVRFTLPATAKSLRLVSRAGVPAEHDVASPDQRRLGICLVGIALVEADGRRIELPLDHPALGAGFHDVERAADGRAWRWTDGDAVISAEAWAGSATAEEEGWIGLELRVSDTQTAWLRTPAADREVRLRAA